MPEKSKEQPEAETLEAAEEEAPEASENQGMERSEPWPDHDTRSNVIAVLRARAHALAASGARLVQAVKLQRLRWITDLLPRFLPRRTPAEGRIHPGRAATPRNLLQTGSQGKKSPRNRH